MSERFKELVLKTSDSGNWAVGSNPTLSANFFLLSSICLFIRSDTQEAEGAPLLRE